ncbi:MAG TPA: hypothetical protein VJU80_03840 [Solirubrobacteraceae bacterium]|nr:hypothetical protein [Solirubrobacteraceae bacterium]
MHSYVSPPRHAQGSSPGESDPALKGDDTSHVTPPIDRSPAESKAASRPGRLEFLLLALVAVGVAITIAMALVDPAT